MCGGRMQGRRRDARTRRYVCAGHRPSHQLAILAEPVDDLIAERVLELLTMPEVREALIAQSGRRDSESLGRALAELGSAQTRLQTLDNDYYVRGVLPVRRYRSIRTRLEREVERLHGIVDRASKQRVILHPDPRQLWAEAHFQQRRHLVQLIVKRLDVGPARRGARFDPSRLELGIPLLNGIRACHAFRRDVQSGTKVDRQSAVC